jgi:hypothetical protein
MRILLRYRDNLPAKADSADKTRLRFFLSRQFKRVWETHFEKRHPLDKLPVDKARKLPSDDCKPYFVTEMDGYRFVPLVSHGNRIHCQVAIRYGRWRTGGMAQVLDSGDLDGRIKALLDGLSIPNPGQSSVDVSKVQPDHLANTCFVLAEDDRLIERVEIETFDILDSPPGKAQDKLETVFHVMVTLTSFDDVAA